VPSLQTPFVRAPVTELTAKMSVNSADIQADKPRREEDFADRQRCMRTGQTTRTVEHVARLLHLSTLGAWGMAHFRFVTVARAPLLATLLSIFGTGCIGGSVNLQTSSSSGSSSSTSTSTSVPSGARAARIIFKNSFPGGSFDAASSTGTPVTPGSGHRASRVFNADGSLLAQGTTSSSWPGWLTGVEIGISGTDNSSATDPNCARFASSGEQTSGSARCNFGAGNVNCGGAAGVFRVSEYDCVAGGTVNGNGGPNDGVYIRAYFSRDTSKLGASENILAVLEYSAAGLRASSTTPSSCFSGGSFTPNQANCSDFVWNVYLKRNAFEVVQPYLLLAPPVHGIADFSADRGPAGVGTRQFIIPLAADSTVNTVQISRVWGMPLTTSIDGRTFSAICDADGDGDGNSPHCVGMVLYSLTFFRM
jgi:hypothetical protein